MKLTQREKYIYAAAILEGEGCFSLTKNYRLFSQRAHLNIKCSMTDRDIVRRLYKYFGGSFFSTTPKSTDKIVYTWQLAARKDVVNLLVNILPFMGKRRSLKIKDLLLWDREHPLQERRSVKEHGSIYMYKHDKCRCVLCIKAMSDHNKNYYRISKLLKLD